MENGTEREKIAPVVDRFPPGLLGRHVLELPLERPALGLRDLPIRFRDSEVAEFDLSFVRNQDVLRRDVAVHDVELLSLPVAPAMRVVECGGHFARDVDGERDGQREIELASGAEDRLQVGPFDIFHRDEVAARLNLAEVVDVHDVRMVQLGRELRLVGEHRDELVIVRDVRQDLLDRDDLLEAFHAGAARAKELGHPSARDLFEELVLTEPVGPLRGDRLPRLGASRKAARRLGGRRGRGRLGSPDARRRNAQRLREHPVDVGRAGGVGAVSRRSRWRRSARGAHAGKRVAQATFDLLVGRRPERRGRRRPRGRWLPACLPRRRRSFGSALSSELF